MSAPEFSIIVAACNVEKYIGACLDSVCGQTFADIEIIVVDDASRDKTPDITGEYSAKDNRIKVIRNEVNSGLIFSRKKGASAAAGRYIAFADGDDCLSADACAMAFSEIQKTKADIIQCGVEIFPDSGDADDKFDDAVKGMKEYIRCARDTVTVTENGCLLNKSYTKEKLNYNLWAKFYKREIIDTAFSHAPDGYMNLGEDLLMTTLIYFFARSYAYCDYPAYRYRFGAGMSTGSAFSIEKAKQRAKSYSVYTFLSDFIVKQGKTEMCAARLEEIKMQVLDNCAGTFFADMSDAELSEYEKEALKYCPVCELTAYLSYLVYGLRMYSQERLAEILTRLETFRAKPRKIKTVGTFYYRMRNGGIENVLSSLTYIWRDEGYRVILFTDEAQTDGEYPVCPDTVRIILPPVAKTDYEDFYARARALMSAAEEYDIDVFVNHAWLDIHKTADMMTVKSLGIPYIIHTHGIFCAGMETGLNEWSYNTAILPIVYRFCDAVIALNESDRAWWLSKGIRCYKTLNPVKLTGKTEVSALNGKNIIVSARIDGIQKQTLQVIEIARLVTRKIPEAKFTLVGGCDDENYLAAVKAKISEYGLGGNVHLVGYVKDVTPYYQRADVMLSASAYEGFSLALTEGKICGLPLVAYYLANWDMARNPEGMINIPQGDVHKAAEAVIKLLNDSAYRHETGAAARKSAEKYLSADIGSIWNEIFTDMENPARETDFSVNADDLTAATDVLMDFIRRGMTADGDSAVNSEGVVYYKLQCNALDETIKEIRNSTSYRIGKAVTAPLRKIKTLLKGH